MTESNNGAGPVHVGDKDFQEKVLEAPVPAVVDFWAPWCGPCHMIAPHLEELAADYAGRAIVAKVNTDEHQDWARRFGIRGIPTLIFFKDGEEADRVVGAVPKAVLSRRLEELL